MTIDRDNMTKYVLEKTQIGYGLKVRFEFNLYSISPAGHKALIRKL